MRVVRTHAVDPGEIPKLITDYTANMGWPPTQRELADLLGISVSTVNYHLRALRAEGIVDWQTGSQRTIHVVQ